MEPEELLAQDPVGNADLLEVLRRGSAETFYRADRALILRDECGTVFFWAGGPERDGREAAARAALPCLPREGLICAHGELCARLAAEHTGRAPGEKCWQARWIGPLPPAPGPDVRLRGLDERYTGVVLEHYHFVDDAEYIRQRVSLGLMMGAFVRQGTDGPKAVPLPAGSETSPAPAVTQPMPKAAAGAGQFDADLDEAAPAPGEELAGFIGLHQEGGIGLLEVFPAYRRRGIAAALVLGMVRRRMAEGAIPFGHIVEGNEPSLRLQTKLGFSFSKEFVYWIG